MAKNKLWYPAVRIAKATELIARSYNSTGGVKRDMVAEYEAIQAWIWVPSLYSLIEQGMKLLTQSYGTTHGGGHRLTKAFFNLNKNHGGHLTSAYKAYVNLHDYIPIATIEEFLEQIDSGSYVKKKYQDGYTAWRYVLLDGFPAETSDQPKTSIGAMLEIATAIRYILEDEFIRGEPLAKSANVTVRLWFALHNKFIRIAQVHCSKPEVQARIQGEGRLEEDTQHSYLQSHDILVQHMDYVIDYLQGLVGSLYRPMHAGGILDELCEFMKSLDRENFLQYAIRVKQGGRAFPNSKILPARDGTYVWNYSHPIPITEDRLSGTGSDRDDGYGA